MNRCLTEGRKAFLARVAGIEAGSECERLAPLLSKLVDGEATDLLEHRFEILEVTDTLITSVAVEPHQAPEDSQPI